MSSTIPTPTPTPQPSDIFGHFIALYHAACVPGKLGPQCDIWWTMCVFSALFIFLFFAFFIGVGIYSCHQNARHTEEEKRLMTPKADP